MSDKGVLTLTELELTQFIALAVAFVVVAALGVLDLLYREIRAEWMYVVLLVCGLATDVPIDEKIFCLVGIPVMLFICALVLGNRRGLEPTDIVGGADIKSIACLGFVFGIRVIAISAILSLLLAAPFAFDPAQYESDNRGKRMIPFCTTMAGGILITYALSYAYSLIA